MQSTWFWPLYGEDDELAFTWSKSRGTAHVEQTLENFHGTLRTDGYAAYDCYARNKPGITQAQCWAHTRRYFIKAEALEPEAVAQALDFIGKLYAIEADIRDHHLDREQCKRVFGLVIDFGTSQSPKSTRPLTTYLCPSRPGHPALRNNFASSLLLRTWLPYDWTPRSEAYFVFPLAQSTPGKQCGLAAAGDYQPSLRSPWLAAFAHTILIKISVFINFGGFQIFNVPVLPQCH